MLDLMSRCSVEYEVGVRLYKLVADKDRYLLAVVSVISKYLEVQWITGWEVTVFIPISISRATNVHVGLV